MKVTFIGTGIMGSRMAKNLLDHKVDLTIYNRTMDSETVKDLTKVGAKTASSYEDSVKDADVVFTMLSTPEVIREVVTAETGFLSKMKENSLWVDCSTVNPSFSLECKTAALEKKIRFLDAPVAGSAPQAESAQLLFLVGGEEHDLKTVNFLLEFMGKKIIHAGAVGKGTSFKMIVNALLAQSMLIYSESVLLGEKMGLSQELLLTTLPELVVTPPFIKAKAEKILNSDFAVQFPLEWMHKDLHLLSLTAYEQNQPLFLAGIAKELYSAAKQKGYGRKDFSAIHQFLDDSV